MADVQHSALTGADLHEPKGISGAANKAVYVADGVGSGSWTVPSAVETTLTDSGGFYTGTEVEAALQELGPKVSYLTLALADISTASFVLFPIPADCVVDEVQSILGGAIATADAVLTISRGGDAATLGTITVANAASAEGDHDENLSLTNNTLTKATHPYIKVATDGASTNAVPVYIQIKITV
jgi:hypothetical protein